jgi:hypothetical protein
MYQCKYICMYHIDFLLFTLFFTMSRVLFIEHTTSTYSSDMLHGFTILRAQHALFFEDSQFFGVYKISKKIFDQRIRQLQLRILSARELLRPPTQVRTLASQLQGHCNGGLKCNRGFLCLRPESHESGRSGRHIDRSSLVSVSTMPRHQVIFYQDRHGPPRQVQARKLLQALRFHLYLKQIDPSRLKFAGAGEYLKGCELYRK